MMAIICAFAGFIIGGLLGFMICAILVASTDEEDKS